MQPSRQTSISLKDTDLSCSCSPLEWKKEAVQLISNRVQIQE